MSRGFLRVLFAPELWRVGLASLLIGLLPSLASATTDCPLAFTPYSSNTFLIDLLINPATHAILERDVPVILQKAPPEIASPTPPTFASILTPRMMGTFFSVSSVDLDRLDADLRAVPLTTEAAVARCARYDEERPALPARPRQPAILVFTKINGFRDVSAVEAGEAALRAMAHRRGWNLVFTDNGAAFNDQQLRPFRAVIWNNTSGDVLTLHQERAFKRYIENGGGFAAFHGAGGDPLYLWDWYRDTLIGAHFRGHPNRPQFQDARVMVDDPKDAIVKGLGKGWSMTDEWYSFSTDPRQRGAHVLVTLDEKSYVPEESGESLRMGDHPIAWTQCIGNGRSFYSAIGHRPESYSEPHNVILMENGITWAARLGKTDCRQGREVVRQP